MKFRRVIRMLKAYREISGQQIRARKLIGIA